MRINIEKAYFKLILLFPIATLFQSYFEGLNKIIFGLLLFFQTILFINKIKLKQFIVMLIVIITFLYNFLITNGNIYNSNELFYFPFAIMFLLFFSDKLDLVNSFFINEKKYVVSILNIWSFLVFISIFFKSSWPVGWGADVYFGSFCGTIFRLAPTALFVGIIALCCMNVYKQKKFFHYIYLPLFCFLMGGSRTYFLVGLLLFILGWYFFVNSKKKFIFTIIPVSIVLVFVVFNSTIMNKFESVRYTSSSYFDFWGTITNGRSIFWLADINYFINSNIINKLFGNGFNRIYEINYLALNDFIWAHNDFIQILVSHGLILLLIYFGVLLELFKKNLNFKSNKFLVCIIFIIWFFNAMFNMCYTYFCALLSIPFMVASIKYKNGNLL